MTMRTMKMIYLLILVLLVSNTEQFNLETCRSPIGIETGKILDSAFSSSSNARNDSSAEKARIRSELNGWCPLNKISKTTYEYLQIDLGNLTVITLIELQGKFGLQPNDHFADSFRIEYRRDSNQNWIKYKDFSGQYILSGNTNSHIPTIRDILPSLIARQIRIIPIVTSSKAKHICIRLELYGCSYQDGPVSYRIPQGDRRGFDVQFIDETYDGSNENGTLKDGLGQLTDGILAGDDYRLSENVQGIGQTGYDWLGWKRRSLLHFNFYFAQIQNLTSIRLHTSNLFTRDIYQFSSILIKNCEKSSKNPTFVLIPDDFENPRARFINISLDSGYGFATNCLKVSLTFNNRSKWILISEVLFETKPLLTANTIHLSPYNDNNMHISQYWYWLLFAICLLIALIVLLIFVYIQWIKTFQEQRKLRKMNKHLKFDSNYQPITYRFPSKSRMACCYLTSNGSTTSDGHSTCSISHNDMRRHLIISTTTSPSTDRATSSSDFGTISTASPTTVSTIYQSVINPYLTAVANDAPNVTSNPYASIDMYTNPMTISDPIKSIQGPCGNSTFEAQAESKIYDGLANLIRVDDEQLILEECYSSIDGCFGRIIRGYIYIRHPYDILKPVLIKALTTNDSIQKDLFNKEHEILNRLNHPNLVQFFGYTFKQNYAIIEHNTLGDLHTFLKQNDQLVLSLNIRLLIITQLTNALRYLESEHIVHRDIAVRNCLIYSNYEIKLTNTAIASPHFQTHYSTIDGCRLPIRWMSPETISHNDFSLQSDVWSFGITLWEVMTNCSSLPYALITDEQVYQRLKLMGNQLISSSGCLQLSKPECLSKELVDLMLECWRPVGERPTFHEIYTFFNKRLDGINIL